MKKIALVVFNGELMCFVHVMLYAKDFTAKGYEVKIVLEGSATKIPVMLSEEGAQFSELFKETFDNKMIDAVCKACSAKMGVLELVAGMGLPMNGEMSGHPSLERYLSKGFEIITF